MAEVNYEKYLVRKPILEIGKDLEITGRQVPTMTYMSNDLVPGSNNYIEYGWIWDMPKPDPHIPEHAHKFNEIVMHIGSDPNNPEDLGGEIEFFVGGQPLVFNTSMALWVPAGVKHGPLSWRKVTRPHIQMSITLGNGAYQRLEPSPESGTAGSVRKTGDFDYEKYLVRKPILEIGKDLEITGRQVPTMTYMSNDLVPGSNNYIEYGWIWDMPKPDPHIPEHAHKFNEIVMHIGSDPNNPEDLGGEIEFFVGGQPLVFNTSMALWVPAGVKHGPLSWRKVTRPHIQMSITLGNGSYIRI